MNFRLAVRNLFLFCLSILIFSQCRPADEPVTDAEASLLAGKITASVEALQPGLLNSLLDVDAFLLEVRKNYKGKIGRESGRAVKSSIASRKFGNELLVVMGKGGRYRLVRRYVENGRQHLVFRMQAADESLSYVDYLLTKRKGSVRIADILFYNSGDWMSRILAQSVDSLAGLMGDDANSMTSDISLQMKSIQRKTENGDYAGALALLDKLPARLKQHKLIQYKRIQLLSQVGDPDGYIAAVEHFQEDYPEEKGLPLLLIFIHTSRGENEKALKDVNDLDRLVKGDPMLDYYRALIFKQQDKIDDYLKACENVFAFDPDFTAGALELIHAATISNKPARVAEVVAQCRSNPSIDRDFLETYLARQDSLTVGVRSRK